MTSQSGVGTVAPVTEADTLRHHAMTRPHHTSMVFGDRRTSYGVLDQRADKVANGLLAMDTGPQTPVALLDRNSDAFFELVFGIVRSGKIVMPVNWRLSPREIAAILQDSGAKTLFVGSLFLAMLPELASHGVTLDHVFVLGAPDDERDYARWMNAQADTPPAPKIDPDDVFIQLYTSGTTGAPKGVQITHRASLAMRAIEVGTGGEWANWGPEDKAIMAMPNFHVSGLGWALMWFARGATCIIQAQAEPRAALEDIERHGVTHAFAVPTFLSMMLDDPTCAGRDYSRLRVFHYGASPISPNLLVRCIKTFGTQFVQYYGMTETTGVVTVLQPHEHDLADPELLKSVGRAYPGVDVRIMDPQGNVLPAGIVGEVCIKTPGQMMGYWKLPQATADSMTGAYYRSGDAGYLNERGYLYLVDRVKDMIVSGGENIYPIEVENAILEHGGAAEVAVIGVPDERWGEAVKAFVVAKETGLTKDIILQFLNGRIARYKIPKSIEFVETLPRNASGKLLKRELRNRPHKQH